MAVTEDRAAETSATLAACPRCGWLNLPLQACEQCGTAHAVDARADGVRPDDLLARAPVIDGRYRVLAKIGEGGMGAVYRVEHIRMGKVMALKVMRPDLAKKNPAVERFRREAQIISRLSHPNTITVFDCGESSAGLLYLAMEYVPGRDLAELIEREGALDERRALTILRQVLRSLGEAHQAGIIHRDIKPGNVMITRTREEPNLVKVLDFGIAKLVEAGNNAARDITGGADLVGTPACMSPEQARGKELDARSDIYSATALLFTMLTGRGPFVGGALQVVTMHLTDPPPRLRQTLPDHVFSDGVEAIVAKGLAKDPRDRFQSAAEMERAIDRVLGDPLASVSMDGELNLAKREDWDAFERTLRVRRVLTPLLSLLVLAALVAGGVYASRRGTELIEAEAATQEHEPNDLAAAASALMLDTPISGTIAGAGRADVDYFAFTSEGEADLSITVTGVPDVNLLLELFRKEDDTTRAVPVAAVDDAPVGGGEALTQLPVTRGRYLVRLGDRRRLDEPDGPARENAAARYTLLVHLEPPRPFEEREPDNDLDTPMLVRLERPVLGRGGVSALEMVTRAGEQPPPPWSVDVYRLDDVPPRETACALLGGAPGATLRLTAYRPHNKTPVRSVQVREGRVGAACVRGEPAVAFEVRVDVGDSGAALYPLAFVSSQPGGFTGLFALANVLPTLDRAAEARRLLRAADAALPRASDAALLREALARAPRVDRREPQEELLVATSSSAP